ncbi:MAG: hypothetical protein MSJ26_06905 [Oscillospiraceae bacterium]|nr:hypothetical protein [Oscillospiraceae bacterium]
MYDIIKGVCDAAFFAAAVPVYGGFFQFFDFCLLKLLHLTDECDIIKK